jgi:hypothetical protein
MSIADAAKWAVARGKDISFLRSCAPNATEGTLRSQWCIARRSLGLGPRRRGPSNRYTFRPTMAPPTERYFELLAASRDTTVEELLRVLLLHVAADDLFNAVVDR